MGDARQTVVFRWLAAGDAGDFAAFDELLHRDVVVHAPLGLSTATVDEEKAVWRDALAAMPDLRHDVQEIVVDGEVEWLVSLSQARWRRASPASRDPDAASGSIRP